MKCQSCNAHLSIDDEKCPYCGTPNPEAVKHRQDMQRFSGEFHRTKSSVLKTSTETAQKYVRIMVICILVVLVITSFLILGNSWNISSAIKKSEAKRNHKEYTALLDQYEADGDAISFTTFYEENNLYGIDYFEKYEHYYRAASNYQYIYYDLLELFEEEQWEGAHADSIRHLCDSLDIYYRYLGEEHYSFYEDTGMYDEIHLQAVERLTQKLESLIQLSFSLSDEDTENFRNLSNAEKQVFIERSYKEHE